MSLDSTEIVNYMPSALQSFEHLPNAAGDPILSLGVLAVGVGSSVYLYFRSQGDKVFHNPSNPGAVRQAVVDVNGEDQGNMVRTRWYRAGVPILSTLGLAALAAGLSLKPEFSREGLVHNTNTEIVMDSAASFTKTHDMSNHSSRFDFAMTAVANSKFKGDMGVVQFGNNIEVTVPLAPFSGKTIASISETAVDPYGADLSDAIHVATSILPNQGKIVVITDGVGVKNDSPQSIASVVQEANKKGIQVSIEVIGQKGSTYTINHGTTHYPASPDLSAFTGVPSGDVHVDHTSQSIIANIDQAISESAPLKQESFWYPSLSVGFGLIAAGIIKHVRQWRSKLI